ncbi:hypothetical protein EDEG_03431 [Edhazardia aedis USNM 41457]|uniref:Uncharacterized protein n=1 Tax=Edhazardia aedis (strain USNM 41457) TaxID=1003232 RepID=J8ZR08_EDHAE|nr:hypothetical protein EDEG_03431 [Edhazardia aedis USNM 41457]|eukprot:EJW02113.1 hypothetical protein EDEG_03431 [Edhazardia aedis USNM 41457]
MFFWRDRTPISTITFRILWVIISLALYTMFFVIYVFNGKGFALSVFIFFAFITSTVLTLGMFELTINEETRKANLARVFLLIQSCFVLYYLVNGHLTLSGNSKSKSDDT